MKNLAAVCLTATGCLTLSVVVMDLFLHRHPAGADASRNGDVNGDGKLDITDAVYLLDSLFRGGPEPVGCPSTNKGLPDTGQAKCYDSTGKEIPCEGAACSGQDGFYKTGCPPESRFIDNLDGTATDTCTGLMWQKDSGDADGDGESTDDDNLRWCDALAFCENLVFAGHDDWRLPNVRELQSIVDYGRFSPSIDPVFDAYSSMYWSSTQHTTFPLSAWGVGFGSGGTDGVLALVGFGYVRAVRTTP